MSMHQRESLRGFLAVSLSLSLLCTTSCHSQTHPQPTFHQLLAKAQQGDPDAQYRVGIAYQGGSSETPKDPSKAVEWFRRLADKGDRRGENALGVAYRHGSGVSEDDSVAFGLFYKAALKGYSAAQANLAGAYASGRGALRNEAEAFSWRVEAAKNAQISAQLALCNDYQIGILIQSDATIALAWCLVAKSGNQNPSKRLEERLSSAEALLTPSQLEEAKSLATSWIANHRDGGTIPMHSRWFLSTAPAAVLNSAIPTDALADRRRSVRHYTRANGCEAGHWVDSVLSDGEIVKLEDGSTWQVDSVDAVDSSLWLETDDVTVCDGKLINTEDKSSVGAHRLH